MHTWRQTRFPHLQLFSWGKFQSPVSRPTLWEKPDLEESEEGCLGSRAAARWRAKSQERAAGAEPTCGAGPWTQHTLCRWDLAPLWQQKGVYVSTAARCRWAQGGVQGPSQVNGLSTQAETQRCLGQGCTVTVNTSLKKQHLCWHLRDL